MSGFHTSYLNSDMSESEERCEFCNGTHCYSPSGERVCYSHRLLFTAMGNVDTRRYPWNQPASSVLKDFLASLKNETAREESFWSVITAAKGLEALSFADFLKNVCSLRPCKCFSFIEYLKIIDSLSESPDRADLILLNALRIRWRAILECQAQSDVTLGNEVPVDGGATSDVFKIRRNGTWVAVKLLRIFKQLNDSQKIERELVSWRCCI
jgi:hypothetical protein